MTRYESRTVPLKFSDERAATILVALKSGAPIEVCAGAAGVGRRTVYEWIERGRTAEAAADATGGKIAAADRAYVKFLRAVETVQSARHIAAVKTIRDAEQQEWKAAAFWLERRHSEFWSQKQQITISAADAEADEERELAAKDAEQRLSQARIAGLYGALPLDSGQAGPLDPVRAQSPSTAAQHEEEGG